MKKLAKIVATINRDSATYWESETLRNQVQSNPHPHRVVGAPEVVAEFHRWMVRDVYWRRSGGTKAKDAISEAAKVWGVSRTMVQKVLPKYRAGAQDWLKKFGADRESTAVLIAQRAHAFRMLAIERERKEEPTS
jgi:hypothetical protein